MTDQGNTRESAYALVPAKHVEAETLAAFSATIWPDRPPERLLSSWWMRADDDCAVAAIYRTTGTMAGLCIGRPSKWMIAGQTCSAVAICDWYVAPAHAARMLGRRLVRHFERPDRMMYAFSMSDDAIGYLARLGWTGPHTSGLQALPLPRLARLIRSARTLERKFELHDYAVRPGALPPALAAELDQIQSARPVTAPAHMWRGSDEWSWRLSVCGERSYRVCVVCRSGVPLGYSVVRAMTPGSSRRLGRISGALVVDLVAVDDDPELLRVLIARATANASDLRAAVLLAVTTNAVHRRAFATMGFLTPNSPVVGRFLKSRAPQYMWLPRGPAASLAATDLSFTFADSDVDFKL